MTSVGLLKCILVLGVSASHQLSSLGQLQLALGTALLIFFSISNRFALRLFCHRHSFQPADVSAVSERTQKFHSRLSFTDSNVWLGVPSRQHLSSNCARKPSWPALLKKKPESALWAVFGALYLCSSRSAKSFHVSSSLFRCYNLFMSWILFYFWQHCRHLLAACVLKLRQAASHKRIVCGMYVPVGSMRLEWHRPHVAIWKLQCGSLSLVPETCSTAAKSNEIKQHRWLCFLTWPNRKTEATNLK